MEDSLRIYCPVSRHYQWLVKPFLNLVDKYWGLPVVVISDQPLYLSSPHQYLPMPSYCQHFYKDPYCRMMNESLTWEGHTTAVISMVDYWPNAPVDQDVFFRLADYIHRESNIARIDLCHYEAGQRMYEWDTGLRIERPLPTHSQLGATSGLLALWRKDFLREFMENHWTFANWELDGQRKMIEDISNRWFSVTPNQPPVSINHVCVTAAPFFARLTGLTEEDKQMARTYIPPGWQVEC